MFSDEQWEMMTELVKVDCPTCGERQGNFDLPEEFDPPELTTDGTAVINAGMECYGCGSRWVAKIGFVSPFKLMGVSDVEEYEEEEDE